jgi:hypothetical protein
LARTAAAAPSARPSARRDRSSSPVLWELASRRRRLLKQIHRPRAETSAQSAHCRSSGSRVRALLRTGGRKTRTSRAVAAALRVGFRSTGDDAAPRISSDPERRPRGGGG